MSCTKKSNLKDHKKHTSSEKHKHSDTKSSDTKSFYYTCSMHPHIRSSKPGKCPICNMNLVKVEVEKPNTESLTLPSLKKIKDKVPTSLPEKEKKQTATEIVGKVRLRKSQLKHFKPEFFPVTSMKMVKDIRLLGSVLQSEETESSIPARIDGRVEKVYVKSTGSFVKKGDPVIDLYSPKLIAAGEEYLLAKRSYMNSQTKEFKDMLKQTKKRLNLWGVKRFQYQRWYKKNKVPRRITLYSSSTGTVRKKMATVGKYFKEGQNLFELSDLKDVWVEMDVYEHNSSLIKLGQKIELEFTSIPGEQIMGAIDFINPVLDEKSRTLKIRATIQNPLGKLKPGMVANAILKIEIEGNPLVIPKSAVIDTGKRKIAWVKVTDKEFRAKAIRTGYESNNYIEVTQGLMDGEDVVIEGSFLLDAQAQLFGGYENMKENDLSKNNFKTKTLDKSKP